MNTGREEYRTADLEVLPAGSDQLLVHARDTGATGLYRSSTVELLLACRQFATLAEHLQTQGVADPTLQRELTRLAHTGFLLRRDALSLPAERVDLPPITTVGFPTCDRPELLSRAVVSYAQNCAATGREVTYTVTDDSPRAATRARYRTELAELASALGVRIEYAGWEEKMAYSNHLAHVAGVPVELVRFACLGDRAAGTSVGANRTALLMHTVGERIVSADDDTVCRTARPPDYVKGSHLDSSGNPLQLWFFDTRDEALTGVEYTEIDLLGQHEQILGQSPAAVLSPASTFTEADPALLRRVCSQPGKIRLTTAGTAGDCGWDNPDFHLFQDGATAARLVASAKDFTRARVGREMIQSVTAVTVTGNADPKFGMCLGQDNTTLLPPFPPVGRAEEVGFGALLSACFEDSYAAHLPVIVQHHPRMIKSFSSAEPFAIGLASWLPGCVARLPSALVGSPATRLMKLGSHLEQLAALPAHRFDDFVAEGIRYSMSALIQTLDERITIMPAYWVIEAQHLAARLRRSALAPIEQHYATAGGRHSLQTLLGRFGQLLGHWPAIMDASAQLRTGGTRLAVVP